MSTIPPPTTKTLIKRQRYQRQKGKEASSQSSTGPIIREQICIQELLQFSKEFIQQGRRTYEEMSFHQQSEQSGITIPYLTPVESQEVNPLLIHLSRAEYLRQMKGHPSIALTSVHPIDPQLVSGESNRINSRSNHQGPSNTQITPIVIHHRHYTDHSLPPDSIPVPSSSVPRETVQPSLHDTRKTPDFTPDTREIETSGSPIKLREIIIDSVVIRYSLEDIVWPRGPYDISANISQLLRDWSDPTKSYVTVKDIPVPLKQWSQLFRGFDTHSWNCLKKKYGEARIICCVFETFSDETLFWECFSTTHKTTKVPSRMLWAAAVKCAREIRKKRDNADAELARLEFGISMVQGCAEFSYRKGNQIKFYTETQGIARRYRELKATLAPWDRLEE